MYFGGGWWWEGMETYPQNFDNFKPQISNRLYLIQWRWESVQSYIGSQYHIMFQKWREEGWLNIYFSRHILEKRFIATPLMIHSSFYHCKLYIQYYMFTYLICVVDRRPLSLKVFHHQLQRLVTICLSSYFLTTTFLYFIVQGWSNSKNTNRLVGTPVR